MAITRFVRNYTDQSTDAGFQFEFFCDRCGAGYQTNFVAATDANVLTDALDAAGNLFGGLMGSIASIGQRARSANWEREHDTAFHQAVQEVQTLFHQCTQCGTWVDDGCWQSKKNRCKGCVETAEDAEESASEQPQCPSCDADISPKAKFCPECGEALHKTVRCPECDSETSGKFCAECGHKL